MARESADREDLLREATALLERAELQVIGFDEPIVAGFRRDGAASFYFGPNVVYQFNANKELRRGFLDERLYKATGGRLAALTPIRSAEQTELRRHDLSDAEAQKFLSDVAIRLKQFLKSLTASEFTLIGQVPSDSDVVDKIRRWLAELPEQISIAGSPRL
jgi:hypothetical protein